MKPNLSLTEIESQTAVELPERRLMAVAAAQNGLVVAAVAVDNIEILNDSNVLNDVCVQVAVAGANRC
jgi:hypothetical protein